MLHRRLLPQIGAVATHLVTSLHRSITRGWASFVSDLYPYLYLHNCQYLDFFLQHGEQVLPADGKQH